MEEKPNYFAVIPANVRYNENLKLGAKMMYGEITSLTYKTGECWASNNYFAKLYKVSPQAISKWIKSLEEYKYVTIDYEMKGKLITKRIIKLVSTDIDTVSTTVEGGINHSLGGYQPEIKENNTSINNTSINNNKEIYKEICKRVIDRFNELNSTRYSATNKNTLSLIKGRLEDGFTEDDLMLVVDKMSYVWNQPNEKDMRKYLRPSTLFRPANFENYLNRPVEQQPRTTKNLNIDFMNFFEEGGNE